MKTIDHFRDDYAFLSNFHPSIINHEQITYPTVEHAYQACKTRNKMVRLSIAQLPADKAGRAKRIGASLKEREDWRLINLSLMRN